MLATFAPVPPDQVQGAISRDLGGKREEFCIGNGGHTHYWDDTAPDIAVLCAGVEAGMTELLKLSG